MGRAISVRMLTKSFIVKTFSQSAQVAIAQVQLLSQPKTVRLPNAQATCIIDNMLH